MPKPYSPDLRQRVVMDYEEGYDSYAAVAARFRLGIATVRRWVNRYRETGSFEPLPHGGGPKPIIDEKGMSLLCELVGESSDSTRDELAKAYHEVTGILPSVATLGRNLWQLGYTLKKRPSMRPNARPRR